MSEWKVRGGDDGELRFTEGTERGVQLATEHLLQAANRTVPIEEGTLMRSGRATTEGSTGVVAYATPY